MADINESLLGTVAAPQTGAAPLTVFAAPATGAEFNTLGERLVPKACFKVEDLLFDFGSSFIRPEMKDHLPKLQQLRDENKFEGLFPPLSIFGHADPEGSDDFNKLLSGRRAIAFYAMLVRDVDMWEKLFEPPVADDNWGTRSIQTMLSTVQAPIGIDGVDGPETKDAIQNFQSANGLGADGVAGPSTRKLLFQAYMNAICDPDFKLDKVNDFLGRHQDPDGKADFQGCSEFNPLHVFSTDEEKAFAANADHTERDRENAPNRRVVALLFPPGRKVKPAIWPCPKAKDGIAGCKKRFYPDADVRRNPQAETRDFEDTQDTFACRFYQIISDDSPCERVKPVPVVLGVNPLILFALADPTVTEDVDAPVARSSFVSTARAAPIVGAIKVVRDIVLVKKPYTNPKRVEVILKTDTPFDGLGTLTVNDSSKILLFPTLASKTALTFNGTDNRFSGAQLNPAGPGVSLFAEGAKASGSMNDFVMTLHLAGGTKKPGPDAVGRMTAIELTLDVCAPRVNATTAPVPMPQPPGAAPGPTPNDKFFLGRAVPEQDDAKIQERAMLMVQPVTTSGFQARNLKLVLVQIGQGIKTFTQESNSDVIVETRHTLFSTNSPTTFFVGGIKDKDSNKPRDNSYLLGIEGIDGDGDRVSVTVVHAEIVSNVVKSSVHTAAIVQEKPAPVSRNTVFFTAPRIVSRHFPIEVRTFIQLATPSSFAWTEQGGVAMTMTQTNQQIMKFTATALSASENDTMIQVRVATDRGEFLYRHRFTVVTVTIDPVASGENFTTASDINAIRNPACLVVLGGADQNDTKKVAKVEMFKFASPSSGTTPATPSALGIEPNFGWTDNDDRISWWIIGDDGGQYKGKADFRNADSAKRGTTVDVFGTAEGDVLIQPYSGGFGYGMFRANALNLRQVKYRVNRIITNPKPPSPGHPLVPGHGPTPLHDAALNHIKLTNLYLRQLGIELLPDNSTDMAAKAGNPRIGTAATDAHIVSVTQGTSATGGAIIAGHFDVVVDRISMTFQVQDDGNVAAEGAVRVNARNEIITFAYVESHSDGNHTLAKTELSPTNHAPGRQIKDNGVPSSSLIKKTGIPNDVPAGQVKMTVIAAVGVGAQLPTPANGARNINLLWGIVVPTSSIDNYHGGGDMIYGETLAHEVGHVLGLAHRINTGTNFPDGIRTPQTKNLMFPSINPPAAENFDIIQVKAVRLSEVLRRNP